MIYNFRPGSTLAATEYFPKTTAYLKAIEIFTRRYYTVFVRRNTVMNTIEINNLTKKYKDITAVNNLSFAAKQGELIALLGVNGAGKTTTVKMLSCLIKPTSGDASIMGFSITNEPEKVKEVINISPQESAIAPNLTVTENLEFTARIYGYSRSDCKKAVADIIERMSLQNVRNTKSKILSGGYARRLSIAMAVITKPKVLFLDEPTLGLDVIARRELWSIIEDVKQSGTVILTTHYMEEAEHLADRIAIMSHGCLKALGTAAQLKVQSGAETLEDAFIKTASSADR